MQFHVLDNQEFSRTYVDLALSHQHRHRSIERNEYLQPFVPAMNRREVIVTKPEQLNKERGLVVQRLIVTPTLIEPKAMWLEIQLVCDLEQIAFLSFPFIPTEA